jgi:hypothetical protein
MKFPTTEYHMIYQQLIDTESDPKIVKGTGGITNAMMTMNLN